MKHALIVAHPRSRSFCQALAAGYGEEAKALGHSVILRDLYVMGFDPCLKAQEIPAAAGFTPQADVIREREMLKDADVFALVYPLWLNMPPAILTGYLERVFAMGFAYGSSPGGTVPMLGGKKLISLSSSGAPMEWVRQTGAWQAMRALFDDHFAAVCGLKVVDHLHFGGIVPGIRADIVAREVKTVREAVARHFGKPPA